MFQSALGFPRRPGLIEQAMEPFRSEGLRIAWLGCYGNHEEACQGVGVVTPALAAAMTGSRNAIEPPPGLDPDPAIDTFSDHPDRVAAGASVRTRQADRYVVVLSHHGYDTMSNPRGEKRADALLALLLRFGNVVLWLNGHIHANRITPRVDPAGGRGFWEVTTGSLVDWPCQARLVELFGTRAGHLAIACTMLIGRAHV